MEQKTRHLLGLSGGKDSSALAVYMRDRVPEMEYFFSDTGKELPETYEFLDRLEVFLGKPDCPSQYGARFQRESRFRSLVDALRRLVAVRPQVRWCTVNLKIRPFEEYVGEDKAYNYVAIRADEDRVGYKPLKTAASVISNRNIPSKRMASPKEDVYRILEESGPRFCLTITTGGHVPGATSASSSANPSGWDS